MEIINWLRSSTAEYVMIQRTINFTESHTTLVGVTPVDAQIILNDEWWEYCSEHDDWGVYAPNPIILQYNNPRPSERDEIRSTIKRICADPSQYIENSWTISLWYRDNDEHDYQILYTIINPILKSDN